ncbi:MAG TPA: DinB family protein [Longimicrobiales bacterium]|nr:DinB family protein [Longimicrobiales bacterium]
MERSLQPLAAIFELNADLLTNSIEGLTDAQANHRLEAGGNSVAFLVAHLTDARHFIADLLGFALPNPLADILGDAETVEDVESLPPLSELLQVWQAVSTRLSTAFESLSEADLARTTKQRFPVDGGTVLDAITFLAQHDSYHVGQIAFLRRQLGLPAMRYERGASRQKR